MSSHEDSFEIWACSWSWSNGTFSLLLKISFWSGLVLGDLVLVQILFSWRFHIIWAGSYSSSLVWLIWSGLGIVVVLEELPQLVLFLLTVEVQMVNSTVFGFSEIGFLFWRAFQNFIMTDLSWLFRVDGLEWRFWLEAVLGGRNVLLGFSQG